MSHPLSLYRHSPFALERTLERHLDFEHRLRENARPVSSVSYANFILRNVFRASSTTTTVCCEGALSRTSRRDPSFPSIISVSFCWRELHVWCGIDVVSESSTHYFGNRENRRSPSASRQRAFSRLCRSRIHPLSQVRVLPFVSCLLTSSSPLTGRTFSWRRERGPARRFSVAHTPAGFSRDPSLKDKSKRKENQKPRIKRTTRLRRRG